MGSNSRFSKPAMFNILTLCIGIILHSLSFQSTAFASPFAEDSAQLQSLVKRYSGDLAPKNPDPPGGPDVSDYPSDDEIRAAFIPPSGPYIFFSGLPNPATNQAPYEFAQTVGGVIVRNTFPASYLNLRFKPNPKRSEQWHQNFLDRVSGIFADKAVEAGKDVYFVGRFDRTVLDCSIWKRIELPTLTDGGINIKLVDYSNFGNQEDYLPPDISPISFRRDESNVLEKRETGYCFDWPGSGDDANDPDADAPATIGYYPGACGVHIQQYQKNEGNPATNGNLGTSDYRLTIMLKDANGELVGEVDYFDAPGGQGVDVFSQLPLVFIATTGNVDDDAISFAYGSQSWDSSSGQCSVGGYDSGSRQMDCGFTC